MSGSIRQEPHRVYWQQWNAAPSDTDSTQLLNQKVVTKSAAVRISDQACAQDVTRLLQTSIATLEKQDTKDDALVLVATLYHSNAVEFENDNKSSNNAFSCKPLFIIKTLEKNDHPLQVRDDLLRRIRQQHSEQQQQGLIAPKLQWFFVPSCASTELPNYIQFDGYCTSDDDGSEDNDSSSGDSNYENNDEKQSGINHDDDTDDNTHWWRNQPCFVNAVPSDEKDRQHQQDSAVDNSISCSKKLQKQQRRFHELKLAQQQLSSQDHANSNHISGFLLKQSSHDVHVWKQVYCVLTDTHLWTVSRLHTLEGMKMARHAKLPLHGAQLIQPNTTLTSPLSTIPHVFQVITKSGSIHNFRAYSKSSQDYWIHVISNRIEISHENEFFQHAQLICKQTTLARNQRMHILAVQPLFSNNMEKEKMVVLRWGMEVAEFRELCRHVASRIPDSHQRPIVVTTAALENDNPTPKRLFSTPPQQEEDDDKSVVDKDTQDMIGSAWDLAAMLLATAVQYIHQTIPTTTAARNSLEPACRHIDYILTGQFRDMNDIVAFSAAHVQQTRKSRIIHNKNNALDAPPIDLFDTLLAQLQLHCKSGGQHDASETTIETPISK